MANYALLNYSKLDKIACFILHHQILKSYNNSVILRLLRQATSALYWFMNFRSVNTVWLRRWIQPVTCHQLKLVVSGPMCDFIISADRNFKKYPYVPLPRVSLLFCLRVIAFWTMLSDRVWRLGKCICTNCHRRARFRTCLYFVRDRHDTNSKYKFNNRTFCAVWLKTRYKNEQAVETVELKLSMLNMNILKKFTFQLEMLDNI